MVIITLSIPWVSSSQLSEASSPSYLALYLVLIVLITSLPNSVPATSSCLTKIAVLKVLWICLCLDTSSIVSTTMCPYWSLASLTMAVSSLQMFSIRTSWCWSELVFIQFTMTVSTWVAVKIHQLA